MLPQYMLDNLVALCENRGMRTDGQLVELGPRCWSLSVEPGHVFVADLNIKTLRSLLESHATDPQGPVLFVTAKSVSAVHRAILQEQLGPRWRHVPTQLLHTNLLLHRLHQRHERIDKGQLPKKLQVSKLPVMFEHDAAGVWYGFKVGDLVRVHRKSDTAHKAFAYRLVKK